MGSLAVVLEVVLVDALRLLVVCQVPHTACIAVGCVVAVVMGGKRGCLIVVLVVVVVVCRW